MSICTFIWRAISLVGTRINTWGQYLDKFKFSKAMTLKTQVLPVPDFACAIKSIPIFPKGIAFNWIGEGCTNPASFNPRSISFFNSNCEKSSLVSSFFKKKKKDKKKYKFI